MATKKKTAKKTAKKKTAKKAAPKKAPRKVRPPKADIVPGTEKHHAEDEKAAQAKTAVKTDDDTQSSDPLSDNAALPKLKYKLGDQDQIVFRARSDRAIGLTLGERRWRARFENRTFVVTSHLAKNWQTTVKEIVEALVSRTEYMVEFCIVSAPGYKPSDTVVEFDRKIIAQMDARKQTIMQGARSTGG